MPPKRTSSTGASLADALGRGSKSSPAAAAAGHRAAQKSAVFAGAAKTATAAAAAAGGKREGSNALSAAHERRAGTPTQASAYTKEQLAEAEGRPPLDADAAQYDTLWREVQVLMGMPKHQPSACLRSEYPAPGVSGWPSQTCANAFALPCPHPSLQYTATA